MKWMRICSAVVVTFGLTTAAQADMYDLFHGWSTDGSSKCCGCASACQPCCCKPVIVRPCCPTRSLLPTAMRLRETGVLPPVL